MKQWVDSPGDWLHARVCAGHEATEVHQHAV